MTASSVKKNNSKTKQQSLQILNDQLILAKSEGNTTQVKLIQKIIDRIKSLD